MTMMRTPVRASLMANSAGRAITNDEIFQAFGLATARRAS